MENKVPRSRTPVWFGLVGVLGLGLVLGSDLGSLSLVTLAYLAPSWAACLLGLPEDRCFKIDPINCLHSRCSYLGQPSRKRFKHCKSLFLAKLKSA